MGGGCNGDTTSPDQNGDTAPDPPVSNQIHVDLAASVSTLGAIQFLIGAPSGGAISGITPAVGLTLYERALPDGSVRVILVGDLGDGEVLRFTINDPGLAAGYGLTGEAGADRTTFALVPTSEFALTTRVAG